MASARPQHLAFLPSTALDPTVVGPDRVLLRRPHTLHPEPPSEVVSLQTDASPHPAATESSCSRPAGTWLAAPHTHLPHSALCSHGRHVKTPGHVRPSSGLTLDERSSPSQLQLIPQAADGTRNIEAVFLSRVQCGGGTACPLG